MRLFHQVRRARAGSAIIMVLILAGASLLLLCAAIDWTSSSAIQMQRNNEYFRNNSAAESAAEKVVSALARDYQSGDEALVYSRLASYQLMVPLTSEDPTWGNHQFTDALGNPGRTYVERLLPWQWRPLDTIYSGLSGYAATYRVISNTRLLDTPYKNVVSAVKQDVQLASIPLFAYGIFYALDMEFHPADDWSVTGPVHCNGTLYLQPAGRLTFQSHVTASQRIAQGKHPDDPVSRTMGSIAYLGEHNGGVKTLNLPLGVVNSSSNVHGILELASRRESLTSLMGRQRYYNKADLIILVYDTAVVTTSGAYNNFAVSLPWTNIVEYDLVVTNTAQTVVAFPQTIMGQAQKSGGKGKNATTKGKKSGKGKKGGKGGLTIVTNHYPGVLKTNVSFFDKREARAVQCTELDVQQLLAKSAYLQSVLGRNVGCIYLADLRTQTNGTQPGIRLVNGATLPASGLTLATPNPLYVQGNFNVPLPASLTNAASPSVPASLVGDAVTILSDNWDDANSGGSLSSRLATNTTVNAAIVTGIVPTGGGYYSGGVENALRLLEAWDGQTLTFNGALVVLYPSRVATAPWGATADVYTPPRRVWNWDDRFQTAAQLPPGTPELRTIIRSQFARIQPNATE